VSLKVSTSVTCDNSLCGGVIACLCENVYLRILCTEICTYTSVSVIHDTVNLSIPTFHFKLTTHSTFSGTQKVKKSKKKDRDPPKDHTSGVFLGEGASSNRKTTKDKLAFASLQHLDTGADAVSKCTSVEAEVQVHEEEEESDKEDNDMLGAGQSMSEDEDSDRGVEVTVDEEEQTEGAED